MYRYRIRRLGNGKRKDGTPYVAYTITVPPEVARELDADLEFRCQLTSEGILYRPVNQRSPGPLPRWASEDG